MLKAVSGSTGTGGSGTVTSTSVTTTNGFAGTVATATTTPAITISTTVTGVTKGNGTALSAATVGTDYSAGTSGLTTGVVKSTTGTGALSIATAADIPAKPLSPQIICNRCWAPNAATVANAQPGLIRFDDRVKCFTPSVSVSGLRAGFAGFVNPGGNNPEIPLGNDYGAEVSFETTVSPTAFVQSPFNGQQWGTCPNNGLVFSDVANLSVPADSFFYYRDSKIIDSASYSLPAQSIATTFNTGIGDFEGMSAAYVSQVATTGTMTLPSGGTTASSGCQPYVILGVPSSPVPCVAVIGDSIADGTGDASAPTAFGSMGYISRGLENVNGHVIPHVKMTAGGDTLLMNSLQKSPHKRNVLQYVTHVIIEECTNDVTFGNSLATLQTELTALLTDLKSIIGPYGKPLQTAVCTLLCHTTSTDSYATTANQTPTAGWGVGGVADLYNIWILSQVGLGLIDAVINPLPFVEDPTIKRVWVANGTPNYATTDGTHPTTAACLLAAPAVTTWATTLTV